MSDIIKRKKSQKNQNQITLTIIRQSIDKIIEEYKNEKDGKINNSFPKVNKKMESLYQKMNIKYFKIKFIKIIKLSRIKEIKFKKVNNNELIKTIEESINHLSIYMIKDYINNYKHKYIQEYIKMLLSFISSELLKIENFILILDIFLKSILDILYNINVDSGLKIYQYKDEYLLTFINDIILAIINYPIDLTSNPKFNNELIKLFNNFFEQAKQQNIFIEKDSLWLQLFQNKSTQICNDETENGPLNRLINFLIKMYKNHIPQFFYNEIFKNSTIDFPYYLISMKFLKKLFISENALKIDRGFKIKNGIYFFGNILIKENINFEEKLNELSLVLSFKINKIINDEEISIFNLLEKDAKTSIISVLINKEKNLVIKTNKNDWNTKIIIYKEKFYLLCVKYQKDSKSNPLIYINTDESSDKKTQGLKFLSTDCCYKFMTKKNNYPKFKSNMKIQLGSSNFFGVLGETLLINKAFAENSIEHLFESNEYYGDLISGNKVNYDLIEKKILFSKNCKNSINHFNKLNYSIIFSMENSFLKVGRYNIANNIFRYKVTRSIVQFLNEKGLEFLIFMLHNINSQPMDDQAFNLYLSKTIEFFNYLISTLKEINNIISDSEYNLYDSYIEFNEENLVNLKDQFLLTLFVILKNPVKDKKRILFDNVRNSLLKCLESKNTNSYFHSNILISLIFDNDLFDQKKYISELNDLLSDKLVFQIVNKDLIYEILLLDFIFESSIKHKTYSSVITRLIIYEGGKNVILRFLNYITKLDNEKKIYHYLKIIYNNIIHLKTILKQEKQMEFLQLVQIKLDSIKYEHCKYCSYNLILLYLLKEEIFSQFHSIYIFSYTPYGFMLSPPFLFIRAIFIRSFNILNNEQKLKFITTKGKNEYNFDYFISLKRNPSIFIEKSKYFLTRFNGIIKYFNFLYTLKENNNNINNLFQSFFSFVVEFIEQVKSDQFINEELKEQKEKFLKDLMSSEELSDFFILYLRFDKNKAIKVMCNYVLLTFIKSSFPFYFYLLSPKARFGKDINSKKIKTEIIINIILEINKKILEIKNNNNNIYFLSFIYKNIIEQKIEITNDLSKIVLTYCYFITENPIFLDKHPLDLNNLTNEELKKIENINRKNNIKFFSEIIIDIFFYFYLNGDNKNLLIIQNIICRGNSSVFYQKDCLDLINPKKEINKEEKLPIFKKNNNNFLFCLYFLIFFFEKKDKLKISENKEMIDNILNCLFADLNKFYKNTPKISHKLEKIWNCGKYSDIYNKMLDICKKKYKDNQFAENYLYEKYLNIIGKKKNKTNNILNKDEIIGENIYNINNRISFSRNENIRAKSFEKKITNNMKEKFTENRNYNMDIFNKEKNNLNQSMILNSPMNIKDYEYESTPNQTTNEENNENIDKTAEKFLKKKMSYKNIIHYYYEKNDNILTVDNIKLLINPKEYFLWKNFTISFKEFIFSNKKFKNISKAFDMYTRNIDVVYSSKKDKQFFLNYPTKIKNYIIDDYYRPFLKPCLKFFSSKYIQETHSYINENLLRNSKYKEDNFNLIKFKRIMPKSNEKDSIECERIQNKGNIFGCIIFFKDYMIFANSPEKDKRKTDLETHLNYIYSLKEEIIIDKNKYTLIFYKDIKEIIKRRVCLNYVGYEFFMKDNHSYFFNFFNKQNLSTFLETINKYISEKSKALKNINIIEEANKNLDKNIRNSIGRNSINNNDVSSINTKETDFKITIIDEPISYFHKMQFKNKYKKGEISNFNYLLLLNKFSSRSYNDYNQYLVFPLLFLDEKGTIKRNLSLPICLNKEDDSDSKFKAITNRKLVGYHFNQHYSTSGYILYYLVRLIPFTYSQIEFQSGKFDLPSRLFSSMKNYVNFLSLTQDNRELCAEFFFCYEFLLNLNHNNFGKLKLGKEQYYLNNVDNNRNETFVQFIVYLRNALEELDISGWIDNIFGSKQFNISDDQPNTFPISSYEEFVDMDKIKKTSLSIEKKIEEIEDKIEVLKFGITPAKIFNKSHHNRNINIAEDEINSFGKKKEKKVIDTINEYIESKSDEKFYFINSNINNKNEIILNLKFSSRIDIFKLKFGENKYNEFSYNINEPIEIEPYNNLFCEIVPGIICIVRNKDSTIQFVSTKNDKFIYKWTCIVTAIEPFIKKEKVEEQNYKKVFIGDENGYLNLMKIDYESIEKDNYKINSVSILKSVKAHRSLIKGIVYNERLNIIISWSEEGVISINNDYSFNFLNIIDLGNIYDIKEILISNYDLICVNCDLIGNHKYKIFCFTLNGIQATFCEDNSDNIYKCFFDGKLNVVYTNGMIISYNCYDFQTPFKNLFPKYIDDFEGGERIRINFCNYYPKIRKYLIIYSDNHISFEDVIKNFI